jgi:hypothetical protein
MVIGAVRTLHCEVGRVAKMRCAAFDLDTVKLLMNIFVRDLIHSISCLTFLVWI